MKLMNEREASRLLGYADIDSLLASNLTQRGSKAVQYKLPGQSSKQTVLAKFLSALFCGEESCWVQITYWHDDSDANQDLFYGYRSGRGDARSLRDASVYNFSPEDANRFISIVSMVLYFSWDARVFDASGTFSINISHDEVIDCFVLSPVTLEQLISEFSRLEMRRL
ncbi:MAG: hypothetical protein WBX18_15630 [Terracidiphilus sp.]